MNDNRISPIESYVHGRRAALPDEGLPDEFESSDFEPTGSPSTDESVLKTQGDFIGLAKEVYAADRASQEATYARNESQGAKQPPLPPRLESDEDFGDYGVNYAASYNANLSKMIIDWSVMSKQDPTTIKSMMKMIDAYDQTDITLKQFGRGLAYTAADPLAWVGLASVAGIAARGIAKNTSKTYFRQLLKGIADKPLLPIAVSVAENAGYSAAMGAADEDLRATAEGREFDSSTPAYWAAGGAAMGGAFAGAGHIVARHGPKAVKGLRQTFKGWTGGDAKTTLTDSRAVAASHGNVEEITFDAYNPAVFPEEMTIDDLADRLNLDENQTQSIVDAYMVSLGGREPNTLDPNLAQLPAPTRLPDSGTSQTPTLPNTGIGQAPTLPGSGIGQATTLPTVGIGQAATLPAGQRLLTQEQTSSITGEAVKHADAPTRNLIPLKIDELGMHSHVESVIRGDLIPQWSKKSGAGALSKTGDTNEAVSGQKIFADLKRASGVKAEELEWLGIEKYLTEDPKKKFTQEEVVQYTQDHMVRVEQVTADNTLPYNEDPRGAADFVMPELELDRRPSQPRDIVADYMEDYDAGVINPEFVDTARWWEENPDGTDAGLRYHYEFMAQKDANLTYNESPNYVYNGAYGNEYISVSGNDISGYRAELSGIDLINEDGYTLQEAEHAIAEALGDMNDMAYSMSGDQNPNKTHWGNMVTDGEHDNYRELKIISPDIDGSYKKEDHLFPDENIVAFLRVTDRKLATSPGGKPVRTLMIDENQSDLHSAGSKHGYSKGLDPDDMLSDRYKKRRALNESPEMLELLTELDVDRIGGNSEEYTGPLSRHLLEVLSESPENRASHIANKIEARDDNLKVLMASRDLRSFNADGSRPSNIPAQYKDINLNIKAAQGLRSFYVKLQELVAEGSDKINIIEPLVKGVNDVSKALDAELKGPPDAPFKKKAWMRLSLARAMIQAKDEGYEAIAWPNGNVLSSRYMKKYEKGYKAQYDREHGKIVKSLTGQKAELISLVDGGTPTQVDEHGYWSIPLTGKKKSYSQFSIPALVAATAAEREEQNEVTN